LSKTPNLEIFAPFAASSALLTSVNLTVDAVWLTAEELEDDAASEALADELDAEELDAACDPHPASANAKTAAAATAAIFLIFTPFLSRF
jgi:hypothetical protein